MSKPDLDYLDQLRAEDDAKKAAKLDELDGIRLKLFKRLDSGCISIPFILDGEEFNIDIRVPTIED